MGTVKRMHWILATADGFNLFMDHHNLLFLIDPLAVVPDLCQTFLRKVLRWGGQTKRVQLYVRAHFRRRQCLSRTGWSLDIAGNTSSFGLHPGCTIIHDIGF